MQWMWTWGGTCFGYRKENSLFTYDGREVGRFHDDEVYGRDGRYLGEVRSENRLISKVAKASTIKPVFSPRVGSSYGRRSNYSSFAMIAGYADFPEPDAV